MTNFSPSSESNPLEMKVAITLRRLQLGLYFSLENGLRNPQSPCNRNGISARAA